MQPRICQFPALLLYWIHLIPGCGDVYVVVVCTGKDWLAHCVLKGASRTVPP
jgi:hypothetical protein